MAMMAENRLVGAKTSRVHPAEEMTSPVTRTPAPAAFTRWLIIGNLLTIALIITIVARSTYESDRQHRELALARVENVAQVLDRYVTSVIDKGDLDKE